MPARVLRQEVQTSWRQADRANDKLSAIVRFSEPMFESSYLTRCVAHKRNILIRVIDAEGFIPMGKRIAQYARIRPSRYR
jgi:hypothetical protein